MLTIDMTHASHEDLTDMLLRYSSLFGSVTEVKIHSAPSAPTMRPYALITMDSREEAEKVAVAFGGRTIGRAVMVALQELEHASSPTQHASAGLT